MLNSGGRAANLEKASLKVTFFQTFFVSLFLRAVVFFGIFFVEESRGEQGFPRSSPPLAAAAFGLSRGCTRNHAKLLLHFREGVLLPLCGCTRAELGRWLQLGPGSGAMLAVAVVLHMLKAKETNSHRALACEVFAAQLWQLPLGLGCT